MGSAGSAELRYENNVRGLPPNTTRARREAESERSTSSALRRSLTTCWCGANVRRIFGGGSIHLVRKEDASTLETAFIEAFSRIPARTSTLRAYKLRMHDFNLDRVPGAEGLEETDVAKSDTCDPLMSLRQRPLGLIGRQVSDDVVLRQLLNVDTLPT